MITDKTVTEVSVYNRSNSSTDQTDLTLVLSENLIGFKLFDPYG